MIEHKQQDEMFLKWSNRINETTYDIRFISNSINSLRNSEITLLDIGGGIGTTANAIIKSNSFVSVDIVDNSILALANLKSHQAIEFIKEDFLEFETDKKYDVVILRTVLHHMVGRTEKDTYNCQIRTLQRAKELLTENGMIFITENFYEPFYFNDLSGRLIYEVTRLKSISHIVRKFGANTAGEGVRFRSMTSWESMVESTGMEIINWSKAPKWRKLRRIERFCFLCKKSFQAVLLVKPVYKNHQTRHGSYDDKFNTFEEQ